MTVIDFDMTYKYLFTYLSSHCLELPSTLCQTVKDAGSSAVDEVHLLSRIFSLKPADLRVSNQVNIRVVGNMLKLFHFDIFDHMNL